MISLLELTNLLNDAYLHRFNTKIIGGFREPFYQANNSDGNSDGFAEIQFSHDYIRSALHELAHWCVAGNERRKLDDYGYWYAVDGRDQQQQNKFFKVEIKPQALEWVFSIVCGVEFEVSIDNLTCNVDGANEFKQNVIKQIQQYLDKGFANRTEEIIVLFAKYRGINHPYGLIQQKI